MRVFNQNKTQELMEYDLNKGYLKDDRLFVRHHDAIEAVLPVYQIEYYRNENNQVKAKRTVLVEEVLPKKAYDEYENIYLYIPYTEEELLAKYEQRVEELIRANYSLSQELAILRQRDTKTAEFAEYNAYAESCKAQAKIEYGIELED